MTKGRTLLTCGEHAVLVEVAGLDEVLALTQDIREAIAGKSAGFTDIVDIVPAARTVLVIVRDDAPMGPVRQALSTLPDTQPGELPSSALSSRGSDEHVTIEGIERPACGMEPETALAFIANDDPGGLVVCIDRISFGHGYPLRRRCRRPLAGRCVG